MKHRKTKENIKKELKKKGLTVEGLNKHLNMNYRYFAESKSFSIERLQDICNYIGISLFDVLEDEGFEKYYNDKGILIKIERTS